MPDIEPMKLMLQPNKGLGEIRGPWIDEAEGGGMGSQIHTKEETYLCIAISNDWRRYELRIPPSRVKALMVECEELLKLLREQGWDL